MSKIGRNALCPCGSGLKYKRCCEAKDLTAEIQEKLGSLDAGEQAEILLYDHVYQAILHGVWTAFHGQTGTLPDIDTMDAFYTKVYGYEIDLSLIDELVFPLPPKARAHLIAFHRLEDEKIVDIPAEEDPKNANR